MEINEPHFYEELKSRLSDKPSSELIKIRNSTVTEWTKEDEITAAAEILKEREAGGIHPDLDIQLRNKAHIDYLAGWFIGLGMIANIAMSVIMLSRGPAGVALIYGLAGSLLMLAGIGMSF